MLLFASEDKRERDQLARALGNEPLSLAASAADLLQALERGPTFVVLSLDLPGLSTRQLLERVQSRSTSPAPWLLIRPEQRRQALELCRQGAGGTLLRPFDPQELLWAMEGARAPSQLGAPAVPKGQGVERLIGSSAPMQRLRSMIQRVAGTDLSVLITGESGTGKEVVARAVHECSLRSRAPFVPVDCAAIPAKLMESELFGYEKGAFTGATSQRKGLVESARGGTFFLDEIGELEPGSQVKLLRLLQEGSYRRVGSNVESKVALRVLAATNRPLEERIRQGAFREDLFHRLNVVRLHLPPLRERPGDVPELLRAFLERFAQQAERPVPELPQPMAETLAAYRWPGNVRELVNTAQYLASLAPGPVLRVQDLPQRLRASLSKPSENLSSPQDAGAAAPNLAIRYDLPYKQAKRVWVELFDYAYFGRLLAEHDGNLSQAARSAGIDRKSIQRYLKRAEEPDSGADVGQTPPKG